MQNLQTQTKIFRLQRNINEVIEDFTISFNSIKTQKRYKTVLKQFFEILEVQQLEQLADVPLVEVKRVFDSLKESKSHYDEHNTTHLLNPSTINNIAYIIKSFFNYLIDYYNYPKNPLSSYKPLKTKEHSSTQSLDRVELLEILKYAKMDYLDIL
jgi:site-specific recombinase XerD